MSFALEVDSARDPSTTRSGNVTISHPHVDAIPELKEEPLKWTPSKAELLGSYMSIAGAACGFISDGYQNNLMTMANVAFKKLYPSQYTSKVSTRVSNSLLVGDVLGQLFVGVLCDRVGRKAGLVFTTVLIVLGATLATAAHAVHGNVRSLFWWLTVARGIIGFGTGGEYPASSTAASESANESMLSNRGPVFLIVTNGVLSFGGPLAVSVFLIVLSAAGENHLNTVWRVCFGIGIVLPMAVFYFRMRMMTPKLYRKGAIKRRVPYWLAFKRYWKTLIGTGGAWFVYDFVFFPNTVFSGTIISTIIKTGNIKATAEWQLLLLTIALPGVWIGILLCNPLGRRNTLMLGYGGFIVFGLIIGIGYTKLLRIIPLFIVLYGLMHSLGSLGPGNLNGLVSAEAYPTPIRGTFYGLSAAIGKTGAAIGTEVFQPIREHLGQRWTFIVAAICGILGIVITYFLVPDMTGVDLAHEDQKFLQYLADNGWEGQIGDEDDVELVETEKASCVEKEKSG
ncbi:MFS Git1p-like glycerophosphoinositol permease [Laetiporus sulphureus 93-53]|uniref:MFS Git1p-like glycerophosphoinositol permease n=1 Tax=Laetiporus sulphureus 93-53 TaxID=1314785 RepID=A0A165DYY3_9APHY|nr:MFS Git1p-like glycerophosphoinositol permease [Laetiporus sulphureus 93-53]KZT05917.1 MFS Git1p-like glycerophosphoinositol permease [Laetiporus sulphureus 93-53]